MGFQLAGGGAVDAPGLLDDASYMMAPCVIPTSAVSQATSVPVPGCLLQWTQGRYPRKVRAEGWLSLTNVSAAAALRVQAGVYLYDIGVAPANFAQRNTWALGPIKVSIFDGVANNQWVLPFVCADIIQAAAGSEQSIQLRCYNVLNGGATWSGNIAGSAIGVTSFEVYDLVGST